MYRRPTIADSFRQRPTIAIPVEVTPEIQGLFDNQIHKNVEKQYLPPIMPSPAVTVSTLEKHNAAATDADNSDPTIPEMNPFADVQTGKAIASGIIAGMIYKFGYKVDMMESFKVGGLVAAISAGGDFAKGYLPDTENANLNKLMLPALQGLVFAYSRPMVSSTVSFDKIPQIGQMGNEAVFGAGMMFGGNFLKKPIDSWLAKYSE